MLNRPIVAALVALVACALPPASVAQPYPNKPVKIVVPFSPGTAADIAARQLGQRLAEAWGQGVVIENQGGAGGNIGAGAVAKAAPDGYTLIMLGINHVINPSLYKEVPYDIPRDFRPIARVAVAPLAIIAPVLLGDGTRLFQHPGGTRVRLERLSVETVPHATNVWMRVLH